MADNIKKETVRIVIQDVPVSHMQRLRIEAAIDGHRFLSPFMRKLIAEWYEKYQKKDRQE